MNEATARAVLFAHTVSPIAMVTPAQAARLLDCDTDAVADHVKAYQIGPHVRFRVADIATVLKPSARGCVHTREDVDMASKISSLLTVRLPNEVITALDEIVANEGVNRTEWLRNVIVPAVKARETATS